MPKSLYWVLSEIEKRPEDEKMIWAEWRRDQPDGGEGFDAAIESIKKKFGKKEEEKSDE